MKRRYEGFFASMRSYADVYSTFSEYNALHGTAAVVESRIGRFTYIAGARVCNATIGHFCSIGRDAIVGGLGRHPTRWASTHPAFFSIRGQVAMSFADANYFDELLPVKVGNDVWIGARVVILDGVTIGDGAIIAAGAIVARDVEPYAVVGGVPARVLRYRFSKPVIEKFLALQWWDWPLDELRKKAHLFRHTGDETSHPLISGA